LIGDLAVRARKCAKQSSQELLCPRKFHPILSAKRWGLVRLSPNPRSAKIVTHTSTFLLIFDFWDLRENA
jgi:hypothetical protein